MVGKDLIMATLFGSGGGSSGSGGMDALINRTITETSSDTVTSIGQYAFADCSTLASVDFPEVTKVGGHAFESCSALAVAKIPKATEVEYYAFRYCVLLASVDFPELKEVETSTFESCYALTSVNIPKATKIGNDAFDTCRELPSVKLPAAISVGKSAFVNCTQLASADFPLVTSINAYAFQFCKLLKALILRGGTVATLSNTNALQGCCHILGTVDATYNPDGLKDGYIYVPRALVDTYKAATNWSTYADQFRALEDYTVDGTITGDLDPTKI